MLSHALIFLFFFFNDTATTEIYTLSLHDALPIYATARARMHLLHRRNREPARRRRIRGLRQREVRPAGARSEDRKSTRLNSSHLVISYAVFCLKKKKKDI